VGVCVVRVSTCVRRLYVKGERAPSKSALPSEYGTPLENMGHMSRRHVAYVFNNVTDETKTYLDGTLLGTYKHKAGTINQLDCGLAGSTAYTGLGHMVSALLSFLDYFTTEQTFESPSCLRCASVFDGPLFTIAFRLPGFGDSRARCKIGATTRRRR
jgi:hypothetical protein